MIGGHQAVLYPDFNDVFVTPTTTIYVHIYILDSAYCIIVCTNIFSRKSAIFWTEINHYL